MAQETIFMICCTPLYHCYNAGAIQLAAVYVLRSKLFYASIIVFLNSNIMLFITLFIE